MQYIELNYVLICRGLSPSLVHLSVSDYEQHVWRETIFIRFDGKKYDSRLAGTYGFGVAHGT